MRGMGLPDGCGCPVARTVQSSSLPARCCPSSFRSNPAKPRPARGWTLQGAASALLCPEKVLALRERALHGRTTTVKARLTSPRRGAPRQRAASARLGLRRCEVCAQPARGQHRECVFSGLIRLRRTSWQVSALQPAGMSLLRKFSDQSASEKLCTSCCHSAGKCVWRQNPRHVVARRVSSLFQRYNALINHAV